MPFVFYLFTSIESEKKRIEINASVRATTCQTLVEFHNLRRGKSANKCYCRTKSFSNTNEKKTEKSLNLASNLGTMVRSSMIFLH